MHLMSQMSTLKRIFFEGISTSKRRAYLTREHDDFSDLPPYFTLDLWKCIGWPASMEERLSFFLFSYHFLKSSVFSGKSDIKSRGNHLVQLASFNRSLLKEELNIMKTNIDNKDFVKEINLGNGFISVYRTKELAEMSVKEVKDFGEAAEIITRQDAVQLEPQIDSLPSNNAYFVHRPNDQTANCYAYTLASIKMLSQIGVQYNNNHGAVTNIESVRAPSLEEGTRRFMVSTKHGNTYYDYIILANGIFTPILGNKLSTWVSFACPTYPIKGYSLTLSRSTPMPPTNMNQATATSRHDAFLKKSLSFDNIYCTSISPNSVRLAGFGELVGFPQTENDYQQCEKIPIAVFEKYSRRMFRQNFTFHPDLVSPCYRPMSPDDVPIVGKVSKIKGLFLHTGHGTLGWTLSLATAYCLAQSVCDEINGIEETDKFELHGTNIDKSVLSPDRFVW